MEKVVVGMSGGVDSSVAALILKNKGYDVVGVTLDVWQEDNREWAKTNIQDAADICNKLGIKHIVVDYRQKFKENVIDKFAAEYIEARTPNPCNLCNRYVKFTALLEYAKEIGAKYIATGHYAKVSQDENTKRWYITKSKSDKKDQTYALYNLTQEQLSHIIMPLGDFEKEEIRQIAEQNGLLNAKKRDSQEICFVPDKDYANYIKKNYNYTAKEGNFEDNSGKVYGKHKGIINYTIGQRKGLGLSLKQPMYVTKIIKDKNAVIIGVEEELERESLMCKEVNFMLVEKLNEPIKVEVKIRYNAKPVEATVIPTNETSVKVVFDNPVKGVAPGQACVFYIGNKLIGGGIIC